MSVYANDNGYFFDSYSGDRTYNSASFEEWLKPFFTDGVFNGGLQVSAQSTPNMTVKISAGKAFVNGKLALFDNENNLTIETAHGTYARIDTIVIRRDNTARTISIEVVKGTASANPQPKTPTRDADTFELVVAQILVDAGTTAITAAKVADRRPDATVCGWVTATVDQVDFDQFKQQFDGWADEAAADFEDWFQHLQDELDDNQAAHLQNEIDNLDDEVVKHSEQTLTEAQQEQARENIGVYGKADVQKKIVMASVTKTLTNGACVVDYPAGTNVNSHYFIIQPQYVSGGYVGWMPVVQAQTININVYARVGGSATTPPVYPPNGTTVSFVLVAIPRQ